MRGGGGGGRGEASTLPHTQPPVFKGCEETGRTCSKVCLLLVTSAPEPATPWSGGRSATVTSLGRASRVVEGAPWGEAAARLWQAAGGGGGLACAGVDLAPISR